jgi:hypothetical protein
MADFVAGTVTTMLGASVTALCLGAPALAVVTFVIACGTFSAAIVKIVAAGSLKRYHANRQLAKVRRLERSVAALEPVPEPGTRYVLMSEKQWGALIEAVPHTYVLAPYRSDDPETLRIWLLNVK